MRNAASATWATRIWTSGWRAWFTVRGLLEVPDVLMLAGAAAVVYGLSMVYQPAAWIVTGVFVFEAGRRLGHTSRPPPPPTED